MERLSIGGQMPDFTYQTPFEKNCVFSKTVQSGSPLTIVLFHRFYGCRLCKYDLRCFAEKYDILQNHGMQMLAAVQSAPASLAEQLRGSNYPFSIICDPSGTLYDKFEILPAESREVMLGKIEQEKMDAIRRLGLEHGADEGNPLQLPAIFVVDSKLIIRYVHYGTTAGDVPSPDTLVNVFSAKQHHVF